MPGPSRVACLLVPDLPLAAELRSHPELRGQAVAVVSGAEARAEVLSATPEALAAGVRLHAPVVHARAACGELVVRVASPALDRSARQTLRDVALSFSPRVAEVARSSGVFASEAAIQLDASGVDALFRSEAGFAAALSQRARQLELPARVGVASSPEVALLAARTLVTSSPRDDTAVLVLEGGRERDFLAPLPIDLLNPEAALLEQLDRFGIRRLGQLARLPVRELTTRLGPAVLSLASLARGESTCPPLPEPEGEALEEASDIEFPIGQLEGMLFVLRGLLSRLLARLESRQLSCTDLELRLALDDGGHDARRVGVAAPTRDTRVLLRLLRLSLETRPPGAAVLAASLATRGCAARGDQLHLWRPPGPSPTVLDALVAELEALCGRERVGAAETLDDWRPDAYRVVPFAPPPAADPPARDAADPIWVLRALRPPAPAEVRLRAGRPAWLRCAAASGRVLHCSGPWRTTGHWWSDTQRFAFDHYEVQTEDGSVCRLRLDHVRSRWEVDGVFD